MSRMRRATPIAASRRIDCPVRRCGTVQRSAVTTRKLAIVSRATSTSSRSSLPLDHCSSEMRSTVMPASATSVAWGSPTPRWRNAADTAAARWKEKDQGIWEVRGEPRDFLYSKLMCWVALDRAIGLADRLNAADRVEAWKFTRDEIADAIINKGWNESVGAFTQSFGSEDLDASNLMMPIVGFLAADDPRMKATIDATAERLTDDRGLVYRYLAQDGLEGEEGTFLLCTFWLAQAQALAGELDEATPLSSGQ